MNETLENPNIKKENTLVHPEALERLKKVAENFPREYLHAITVALNHEIKNIEKSIESLVATNSDRRVLDYYPRELKDLHRAFLKE